MNNTNLHLTSDSSKHIIDALITRQYMNILGSPTQNDGILYQLIQLIICMSIEDIRSAILNLIKYVKELALQFYTASVSIVSNMYFTRPLSKSSCVDSHKLGMKGYKWDLEIEKSDILLTQIVNSINNHTLTGSYDKFGFETWEMINLKEQNEKCKIANIMFNIDDNIKCYVTKPDIHSISYIHKNGVYSMNYLSKYDPQTGLDPRFKICTNPPNFTQIVPFHSFASCLPAYFNKIISLLSTVMTYTNPPIDYYDYQAYTFNNNITADSLNNIFTCCFCISLINATIDENGNYIDDFDKINFNDKKNIINWGCVLSINGYDQHGVKNGSFGPIKPICSIVTDKQKILISLNAYKKTYSESFDKIRLHLYYASRGLYIIPTDKDDKSLCTVKYIINNPSTVNSTVNSQSAKFEFYSDKIPVSEIKEAVIAWKNTFTKTIIDTSNVKGTKQKIFYISTDCKITTTSKSNPNYDEWQEKYKTDDLKKPEFMERLAIIDPPPPKRIESSTSSYELVKKEMREIYKPFNTLYLSSENHTRIKRGIELFRDKKEILQSMGLPNKFGLFLYGPPGTGKTSTIYAVASELARPVYYVHLRNHMTCKELQMILDHIYKDTVGGGIVVFEDIDVMSNVVLAGTAGCSNLDNVVNIGNNPDDTPLSLSYFLNVLDGALTCDNSVIICTTNHPELIHEAFMRIGRFDMHIKLDRANHDQICAVAKQMLSHDISSHIIASIPEYKWSTSEIIFRIKDYMLDTDVSDETIFAPFMEQTGM